MTNENVFMLVLFAVLIVGFILWQKKQNAAKEKSEKAKAIQRDLEWAASYQNPNSPNYDAARVADELKIGL